jgi:hypothetical protein
MAESMPDDPRHAKSLVQEMIQSTLARVPERPVTDVALE